VTAKRIGKEPRPLVAAREELSKGQCPQVIVFGCADSRMRPEFVFEKNLSDLFVARTARHIADPIALGSID
jgi:carbonic anhydrase